MPGARRKLAGERRPERTEGRWGRKNFFNNSIVQVVVVVVVVVLPPPPFLFFFFFFFWGWIFDVGPESSKIIFFNSTVHVIVC